MSSFGGLSLHTSRKSHLFDDRRRRTMQIAKRIENFTTLLRYVESMTYQQWELNAGGWGISDSITPSNSASWYRTDGPTHNSSFARQYSPPDPNRMPKRQRITSDTPHPTESCPPANGTQYNSAPGYTGPGYGTGSMAPNPTNSDAPPPTPVPPVGGSTQFTSTLPTPVTGVAPAFFTPTPVLTPGSTTNHPTVPPTGHDCESAYEDPFYVPTESIQVFRLGGTISGAPWPYWMEHRIVFYLTSKREHSDNLPTLREAIQGIKEEVTLEPFAAQVFLNKRTANAIVSRLEHINSTYKEICRFHAYCELYGLRDPILRSSKGCVYDRSDPKWKALQKIVQWIEYLRDNNVFAFTIPADMYYAWTSDEPKGLFQLMDEQLRYWPLVGPSAQRTTDTTEGPSTSQVGGSMPLPRPNNLDYREVGPTADDGESDNNPTEGSLFSASNLGSNRHNHPFVGSGTPPTSVPRDTRTLFQRQSALADTTSNEFPEDTAPRPFHEQITHLREGLERHTTDIINTATDDDGEAHRVRMYRELNEIAQAEAKNILELHSQHYVRKYAIVKDVMSAPHTAAMGKSLWDQLEKADPNNDVTDAYRKMVDQRVSQFEVRLLRPHVSHSVGRRARVPGSNGRSPSIRSQSIGSVSNSPAQISRRGWQHFAPGRNVASPSSAPLTIPSPAPGESPTGWPGQGSNSAA
ncbi:hypothetical protein FRC11_005207 [Ceratobasidium sp. 423]|nr:hypothetical protein FRC11_005207 [Ceratobasidium sp. 423]